MDKYIEQSIEARKNAISATYDVDTEMNKKIDKLFGEIEKIGAKCKDVGEFEVKFTASPLNQQYLDLFTEIATSGQTKVAVPEVPKSEIEKMVTGGTAAGIVESAADQAINSVVPTRAAVNQKISDTVRSVPVVGNAVDIGQKAGHAAHLGKLFDGRKKKREE